ncbi:MAG: MFS transporter [Pseudanabaena sp. CAN_BIN31]|nr:MFS transporter [Pseudanabaena sp. CAN_BIN31]
MIEETLDNPTLNISLVESKLTTRTSIRNSLRASTMDGGLAEAFNSITGGVLLNKFLLDLGANAIEIGAIASLPMISNLLQPLGALLSNQTSSRHNFGLWIFLPARLLWLLLLLGIIFCADRPKILVYLTLALISISNILGALGGASWMSWLAALVPSRLRGRYYSVRQIVSNLASLISLPLASLVVSRSSNAIAGYGIVLSVGIVAGLLSLGCQQFMKDINPQDYQSANPSLLKDLSATLSDRNLRIFLIYAAIWGFAINLSTPFFNLYMLNNLGLDITWVTLFDTLYTGANMLTLLVWGRLSDRFGNRYLLLFAGVIIAVSPLFWLLVNTAPLQVHLLIYLALFHIIWGGTWSAIDLCTNNIQIGIAPIEHRATFFAIAAAVTGVSSAFGTTVGGFLAQDAHYEGIWGVFFLSAVARAIALIPLLFVNERR